MRYGFRLALVALLSALALCQPALAGPALLFDAASGAVIYSEDVDEVWHPASLTKLMTAYVTFEALKQGKLKSEPAKRPWIRSLPSIRRNGPMPRNSVRSPRSATPMHAGEWGMTMSCIWRG